MDKNRILGLRLGIVNAAYMAINDNKYWYNSIEGGQIEQFRKEIEARKRKLSKQAAYCGSSRIGHGRKKRMLPADRIGKKIANFRNTVNHAYAQRIVEMAIRMECGVIQMEDLSGIKGENKFLENWTYFDLQEKIKYKATEHGIEVRKINPQYTSQRCSECGHISKENLNSQSKFHCEVCKYEANQDFNAAKNIATANIEEIIETKYNNIKQSST